MKIENGEFIYDIDAVINEIGCCMMRNDFTPSMKEILDGLLAQSYELGVDFGRTI